MEKARTGLGHIVSAVGALVALVSLWQPWLVLHLDKIQQEPAFQAQIQAIGGGPQLQAEINRFIALLPKNIAGNGWDTLKSTDIFFALTAAAVLALFFATVALDADPRGVGKIMSLLGIAGLGVVLYKFANSGIPDEVQDFVTRGRGPLIALIGWTVCAGGGILTFMNDPDEEWQPAAPVVYKPAAAAPVATAAPTTATPFEPPAEDPFAVAPPQVAAEEQPLIREYQPDPSVTTTSVAPPPRS